MFDRITALTCRGQVDVEPNVPLADLNVGDFVLGSPSIDLHPIRSLHRVIEPYGNHRVPLEQPASILERVLSAMVDRRRPGVLVELVEGETSNEPCPAMFTEEFTPALDRVTNL